MDSEHRHDLKTNELADWIGHIPEFVRRNVGMIIGIACIIAAVGLYMFNRTIRQNTRIRQQVEMTETIEELSLNKQRVLQNQMANMDSLDQMLISANSLEIAAQEAKNPLFAALALIKRGEALRADLHYKNGVVEPEVIQNNISNARKAYEEAIEKAQGNNTLTAMAKFGLGLCAEELGDFTLAESIYKEIVNGTNFEGTVFPAKAQFRLDIMPDNKESFVFTKTTDLPVQELDLPESVGQVSDVPVSNSETTSEDLARETTVPTSKTK